MFNIKLDEWIKFYSKELLPTKYLYKGIFVKVCDKMKSIFDQNVIFIFSEQFLWLLAGWHNPRDLATLGRRPSLNLRGQTPKKPQKVRGQGQTHGKKLLPEANTGLWGSGWPHKHGLASRQVANWRFFLKYCLLTEMRGRKIGLVGKPTKHLCHPAP